MSKALAVLAIPVAVIGYGFYDAYATEMVDPSDVQMRLEAVSWHRLYFDSMGPYLGKSDDGAIYVKASWQNPSDRIVRKVVLGGEAWLEGKALGRFEGECQRGGKTWLGDNDVRVNALSDAVNNDPVCFIRMKHRIDHVEGPDGRAVDDAERERVMAEVDTVEIRESTADVRVSNRPMRYVTWIQEKWDQAVAAVSAPFART